MDYRLHVSTKETPQAELILGSTQVQNEAGRCLIYALCDPSNDDVRYIGKTKNLSRRLKSHWNAPSHLRKTRWLNKLKQGGLNPSVQVLEYVDEFSWQEAERKWISFYRGIGAALLNHTDGGEGINGASPETRQKLSNLRKSQFADPSQRERWLLIFRDPARCGKISRALRGKPKTAEHIAKLHQNQKGHHLSPRTKINISKSLIGNQRAKGLHHTEATKARISNALKGNQHTRGYHLSVEHRKKIGLSQLGKPKTMEQRLKMSEARRRWWLRKKEVASRDSSL